MLAVPPDAGLRKEASYGFVAVDHHIKIVFVDKRQFYRPIVGQVQAAPGAVFEAGVDGGLGGAAGFGKNGGDAVVEVFFGVGSVAEMEFPVGIEVDALAGGALGAGLEGSSTKEVEPEVFECLHEWFSVCYWMYS